MNVGVLQVHQLHADDAGLGVVVADVDARIEGLLVNVDRAIGAAPF